jgi:hypothetical protein
MNDSALIPELSDAQIEAVAEIDVLARTLATRYRDLVELYIREFKLSPQDAVAKAEQKHPELVARALALSPRDVAWFHIQDLQRIDPELAVKRWNEIKAAAHEELVSGHYAAHSMPDTPFERAQFLAVRHAFKEQWQPRNAGELVLVDMLSQLYVSYLDWMSTLQLRAALPMNAENGEAQGRGRWKAQRISEAEAIEQAGMMVDRLHRLFTRTIRTFRDLRRFSLNLNITNQGQMNVGTRVQAVQMKGRRKRKAKTR